MNTKEERGFIILGVIQAFVAMGALPVGYLLITHPDGSAVGMSVDILAGSPFHDFLLPGIALFIFNGVFHLVNAIVCFFYFRFAPPIAAVLGFGLMVWIGVQVCSIGLNSFLQPAFFLIGCLELILGVSLIQNRNKR
ncbi:MAG: hypothetical protein U0T77_11405 [Chitinophagales bacterium]